MFNLEQQPKKFVVVNEKVVNSKTNSSCLNVDKPQCSIDVLTIDYNSKLLSCEQICKAERILKEFADLFALDSVTTTSKVKHNIQVSPGVSPINQMPYRTSPAEKEIIQTEVNKMLEDERIQHSFSPWAAPVVLIKKKDGTTRFCIDYRKLNMATIRDVYPLPRIDDFLSVLIKGKWFSIMDLTSGYHQIPMDPQSRDKTAFVTDFGLFEWNVMPFGLTNAPATFQRLMDCTLAGLKWKCLLVYLDDICVFSPDFDSHVNDLIEVFTRLRDAKLKLKPTKCHFFQKEIKYLGHVISENGISVDPSKIKAIQDMPYPKKLVQLQSFLGMINYYRKFVCNFSEIALPLYELTKTNATFKWEDKHSEAFQKIKEALLSVKILAHPNFKYPFKVQTDASEYGIGAVLTQNINGVERSIQY